MIKEFKEFITRGNVIDLAVGVIIGGAFTTIVNALVSGIITPLIGVVIKLITDHKNLDSATQGMSFKINGIAFNYGMLISAIITFLITAFVLFLIVKAINKAQTILPTEEEKEEESEPVETTDDILNDIRQLLKEQATQTKETTQDK